MRERITKLFVATTIVAALLLPATASAAGPADTCAGRICRAWRKECVRYVYIFGRPVCRAWTFTCIKWL